MNRLCAVAAILALVIFSMAAEAQSVVRESERAPSPALGHPLAYSLYLPPGYGTGDRHYPTLYLLHGMNGNHHEWLRRGHLRATLDRLIAAGAVAPMIVVMPDGGANSWYVDSKGLGGAGNYATAIGVDLVHWIDHTLRTKPERRYRGIGGLSMGGFGALRLAFAQPYRFCAAASFSGALWPGMLSQDKIADHAARIFAGAFGQPFDRHRFIAENPLTLIAAVARTRDPPAVFLTVGDDDRYKLYDDAFVAFDRMRRAGLDVSMRVTGGDHVWSTWARELPDALVFFDREFKTADSDVAGRAPQPAMVSVAGARSRDAKASHLPRRAAP